MRRFWMVVLAALAVAVIGLAVAPPPIHPVGWKPPIKPELRGPLAPNFLLSRATILGEGLLDGPEDVAPDDQGRIYTGVADGRIVRLSREERRLDLGVFAVTGGRPLGLDFDMLGTLWVADSALGLLSVSPEGEVTERRSLVDGVIVRFADDVDVAPDGRVYFSEASTRFRPDELLLDVLEARPYGRLLEYDPVTNDTRVLLEDLYFANGVAVSQDASFVLVCETFRYRVKRYWLTGPDAGSSEIFVDNLPGFPDGISSAPDGLFWLALAAPRSGLLDRIVHPMAWLKSVIAKLPTAIHPGPGSYGMVVALEQDGRYLQSFHDPGGSHFPNVTSAEEHDGQLYLGTVEGDAIARLTVRDSPAPTAQQP